MESRNKENHRRIQLTVKNVLEGRIFDDVMARCAYHMDIHNPAGSGTLLLRLPASESYDIPLRSLIPIKVENLLVAGRCILGTHKASASYRTMATYTATGQGAGVCAAISTGDNMVPRKVVISKVQEELRKQRALI
ncbi:MAG: FAD-dependent oxidoreductase [Betaproteobacteria bacterium]